MYVRDTGPLKYAIFVKPYEIYEIDEASLRSRASMRKVSKIKKQMFIHEKTCKRVSVTRC